MKPVVEMVVSKKMKKSVVMTVDRLFHHKVYNCYVKRTSKFIAHDENDECNIDHRVISISSSQVELMLGLIIRGGGQRDESGWDPTQR
ncbi:hypothetical protein ACLOJK_028413 [Asimina triloba]